MLILKELGMPAIILTGDTTIDQLSLIPNSMKKVLLSMLALCIVFSGCEKDDDEGGSSSSTAISVSPSTLRFSKSAGTGYVYVTAAKKWNANGFTLNCDCSPHTGNAGTTRVCVTVKRTSVSSTHTIRFSSGGKSTILTVKQS